MTRSQVSAEPKAPSACSEKGPEPNATKRVQTLSNATIGRISIKHAGEAEEGTPTSGCWVQEHTREVPDAARLQVSAPAGPQSRDEPRPKRTPA